MVTYLLQLCALAVLSAAGVYGAAGFIFLVLFCAVGVAVGMVIAGVVLALVRAIVQLDHSIAVVKRAWRNVRGLRRQLGAIGS
jgi:hypothetical protein